MWRANSCEKGGTLLMVVIAILTIAAFILATVYRGQILDQRIALQTAADAAAMSGATVEARSLNLIAGMNEGILICMTLAFIGAIILMALLACAGTIVGAISCGATLASVGGDLINIISDAWET